MKRNLCTVALICATVTLALPVGSAVAQASETSTYRWDLSEYLNPHGIGGFTNFLLHGPLGGTVVNTRIVAEFVTADAWDAANININLQGPVAQPNGETWTELDLWGTDFDWSGPGHFQVAYDTDALNGLISTSNGVSLWVLDLNDWGNFSFGRYLTFRIELEVEDIVADASCAGDLNGDGIVDATDLQYLQLGACPGNGAPCPADLNGDGVVTQQDRNILIGFFGIVCPYVPNG